MSKNILILGAGGQLGSALSKSSLWPTNYKILALTHAQLDLKDPLALQRLFEEKGPFQVVLNAVVFMPVDRCEKFPEEALQTNGLALFPLAQLCKTYETLLVHFSTDYVFDGLKKSPYEEKDPKNPLNVYGRSKYIGELILESVGCPYFLIRSSWIFSPFGQNFVKKVWEWSTQDRTLTIVDDQIGCPTSADDVVAAAIHMVTAHLETPQPANYGTFHVCGKEASTWYDFASFILAEISKVRETYLRIQPITSEQFQKSTTGVADRPSYAVLNCTKIKEAYGISSKDWKNPVRSVVSHLSQTT